MKHILTTALLTTALLTIHAQRQRTTMTGRLRPAVEDTLPTPADTTLTAALDSIVRLSGYDKPVTASRESMHLTNLSDSLTITGISFELRYLDKAGRELHRRDVTINNTIAPGRTELVTFPTWDIQRTFYYILSPRPRRQATPYDIALTLHTVTVTPRP